jgi:RNA polymerase sigma factor (sigma-70 family)
MVIAPPMEETVLVRRAQAGDRAAFQDLYETYLPKIYDFSLGMLRNRADAEDVTSETFLRAVERLGDLREAGAFKGWLYTIARNAALRTIDGRGRATPVAEHLEAATTLDAPAMPQPEARAEQTEMRELFDDAASTLSERERTVYDLTVRHGLGSAEVARVLGVRQAYAYILVNRLKGSVSEALEAVLLAKVGRDDCAELATLLDVYRGEISPRMRKAVSRHAKTCAACAGTKRSRASVPALLEGMAFAQPGTAFASELGAKIDAHWQSFGPQAGAGGAGGAVGAGVAGFVGAGMTVVLLTGAAMGVGAQRTIVRHEPVGDTVERASEVQPVTEAPDDQAPPAQGTQRRRPSGASDRSSGPSVVGQSPNGVVTDDGRTSSTTTVDEGTMNDHPTDNGGSDSYQPPDQGGQDDYSDYGDGSSGDNSECCSPK